MSIINILLKESDNFLKQEGLNKNTVINYRIDLNDFIYNFLEKRQYKFKLKALSDITYEHADQFREYLKKRKLANTTIRRKIFSTSSFFKFLIRKSVIEKNIFDGIRLPLYRVKNPMVSPTQEEMKLIISFTIKSFPPLYTAIIYTLINTGARESEIRNIKFKDYQKIGEFYYLSFTTKAEGFQKTPLQVETINAIEGYRKWLRNKFNKRLGSNDYLFNSQRNLTKLSKNGLAYIIKKCCSIIERPISAHCFRSYTICRMRDSTSLPLERISKEIGHRSIQTTIGYISIPRGTKDSPFLTADFF